MHPWPPTASSRCFAPPFPRRRGSGLPTLGPLDDRPDELAGGAEKAVAMRPYLREWAALLGVELLELHELVGYSQRDGFHLEAESHRLIGEAVAARIQAVFA